MVNLSGLPTSNIYNFPFTKPWVYHSLFWISYYLFAALISLSINQIYDARFYWDLFTLLPPDMLLVYANLYFLVPRFLVKRKFAGYFAGLGICMSLLSFLNIALHHWYALAGTTVYAASGQFNIRNFAGQMLNSFYLVGLVTGLKFSKDWMLQQQKLQEKERQQVATELSFLKSQIHPHFFFNTLNNLYSLTLQKSDLAPEVVLKLSDLMSYMLYESEAPLVPLDKEISSLENYLALEKLRFGSRLGLSFEIEGSPVAPPFDSPDSTASIRIPPLILLTFAENSFKHGINQTIGDGRIAIALKVVAGELWFEIDNPVGPRQSSATSPTDEKNGIGLKNVTRRLDLLYGPRYQLDITETEGRFHVTLKLPLS
jgi:two-component system, LytTR family, sensor kinase